MSQGYVSRILGPAKRRLCWCCGGKEEGPPQSPSAPQAPPDDADLSLKALGIVEDLPMPESNEELNAKFTKLVNELGLDAHHSEAMFALPAEKKWQIYCSRTKDEETSSPFLKPGNYVDALKAMSATKIPAEPEGASLEAQSQLVDGLKTALRTQPMSFVVQFLDLNGLTCLLDFLASLDRAARESNLHTALIGCISNLMNSAEGRGHVLAQTNSICRLAESLSVSNARTKTLVLEILGAICIVPGGHHKVLQAMSHFQRFHRERARFQTLLLDLDQSLDDYRNEVNLKTAIVSFINAAINYGPGQTHLEFRLHLRYELLMLGIESVMDKLRGLDNATLNRHLDFFAMVRIADEKELAKRFDTVHIDSRSATSLFDLLRKKLSHSPAFSHLQSILFHLLHLPYASTRIVPYWQLLDRIVQQVTLQQKEGDPDAAVMDIDVKKLLSQLTKEESVKEAYKKMRDVENENDELASKLTKKERDCETKAQEKEELIEALHRIQTKHEKEIKEDKLRIEDLTSKIVALQNLLNLSPTERQALAGTEAMHDLLTSLPSSPAYNAPGTEGLGIPPPPPLMMDGTSAPPPPPPLPGLGGYPGAPVKKKNIPEPTQPLKSFNWTKIPDNKLSGTIWTEIDEVPEYKSLDLSEFERNFSAYQRKDANDLDKGQTKAKELSVIDGRRAQNCTILLSKLKMSCRELAEAILSVDAQDDIPKDMCEQLLKFIPTNEEVQMLNEHAHELEQMAIADYFLFQMSRIERYEDRLKALFYKKKYHERMNDAIPKVRAVLAACGEVSTSRCLRRVLQLVLALGNYMNRGQRSNASGFRVSSLNKIVDTRSSIDRRATLVHYLVQLLDAAFASGKNVEQELSHVKEAAKVNRNDLETEIGVLRMGIADIQKVIEYHKRPPLSLDPSSERLVSVLTDFLEIASLRFSDLEDDLTDMRKQFEHVVVLFGEDSKSMQPDEFFGIFTTFLNTLNDARMENVTFQKQREEEERRAKREIERRENEANRLTKQGFTEEDNLDGRSNEFDDLMSALRTGDVFRDELLRDRRKGGRKTPSTATMNGTAPSLIDRRNTSTSKLDVNSSRERIFAIS